MLYLTNDNVAEHLNTGKELTGQCLSAELEELYLGVQHQVYMETKDAAVLLHEHEHEAGLNPLYRHVTPAGLARLLDEHTFVVTDDE